jgi:hypothetical protein
MAVSTFFCSSWGKEKSNVVLLAKDLKPLISNRLRNIKKFNVELIHYAFIIIQYFLPLCKIKGDRLNKPGLLFFLPVTTKGD